MACEDRLYVWFVLWARNVCNYIGLDESWKDISMFVMN
jgi:hypothetical protein